MELIESEQKELSSKVAAERSAEGSPLERVYILIDNRKKTKNRLASDMNKGKPVIRDPASIKITNVTREMKNIKLHKEVPPQLTHVSFENEDLGITRYEALSKYYTMMFTGRAENDALKLTTINMPDLQHPNFKAKKPARTFTDKPQSRKTGNEHAADEQMDEASTLDQLAGGSLYPVCKAGDAHACTYMLRAVGPINTKNADLNLELEKYIKTLYMLSVDDMSRPQNLIPSVLPFMTDLITVWYNYNTVGLNNKYVFMIFDKPVMTLNDLLETRGIVSENIQDQLVFQKIGYLETIVKMSLNGPTVLPNNIGIFLGGSIKLLNVYYPNQDALSSGLYLLYNLTNYIKEKFGLKSLCPNLPSDADHDYLMYNTPILYSIHFFCEYVMNIITSLAVEFSKRMCNIELDFDMLKRDNDALNEFILPVLQRILKNITLWSQTMESAREWYNYMVQQTFDTLSSDIDKFENIGSNKRELDEFMNNKYSHIRNFVIQHCAPHARARVAMSRVQIPQVPSAPQSPVELSFPSGSQGSTASATTVDIPEVIESPLASQRSTESAVTFHIPEGLVSPPPDYSAGMMSLTPLSQSPAGSPARGESIESILGRAPAGSGGLGRAPGIGRSSRAHLPQ